jgi:Fe-S-cluster containining protein
VPAHLKENIAKVKVDLETRQIRDIHLYERSLRFRCKRCAIYCCKLGPPNLSKEDIEQIESTGYEISEFVEDAKRERRNHSLMTGAMKSKKDGSCIFLRADEKSNVHECSIYDIRPTLCRLYPFEVKRINTDSFLLKIIPCCNGLNDADGELVNKRFVKHLLESVSPWLKQRLDYCPEIS